MEKVTFFFKNGRYMECLTPFAIEVAISMLTSERCDIMVITEDDGEIYPIELLPHYKVKEGEN